MPGKAHKAAVSKQQGKAAGMAYAAKSGQIPKSELKGAAKDMAESMTKGELRSMAKTKRKNLPTRKEKE